MPGHRATEEGKKEKKNMPFPKSVIAFVATLALSANALGVPITFDFGGTITETNPNRLTAHLGFNEFPDAVVGETFFGHITVDPETYLQRSDTATSAAYWFDLAAMTMQVTFGNTTLRTDGSLGPAGPFSLPPGHSRVEVIDDRMGGAGPFDALHILSQTLLLSGSWSGANVEGVPVPAAFMAIDLFGGPASSWAGTDIPMTSIDPDLFSSSQFSILGGFPNVFVRGTMDFFTPRASVAEPSSIALLLLAFAAMMWAWRSLQALGFRL